MIRQAVVAAGGKGTRLGQLAKKYGNKSLIPIEGKPILLHTIQWLEEAGLYLHHPASVEDALDHH